MTRAADWVSVTEAIAAMLDSVTPTPVESVPLLEAAGRILATPITSPLDLPPWDNSGMDGYAVASADLAGAAPTVPVRLRIAGTVAAGDLPSEPLTRGTAIRIMTGAPVPPGADSVIRVEHTRALGQDAVEIRDASDARRNIRPRGEDVRAGETVLDAGHQLRPGEIGVLASIGVAAPPVHRRPRVALLATGNELVDLDSFAEVVAGRRIVNSNSYALRAGLAATGCVPHSLGIARDDRESLTAHLQRALDADALITTAGASVGEHDLVKDALEALGFTIHFWRVRMRPGSPFSFGSIARPGLAPLPVFGLPGNPVSAVVTFEVLVRPVLRRLAGRGDVYPPTLRVRADREIASPRGLMRFLRARLRQDASGEWWARLTGAQGSGILTSMLRAHALVIVPEDRDRIDVGETALAIPLWSGDGAQAAPGFEQAENEHDQ